MAKSKRGIVPYSDLTESRKDRILEHIRAKGISILAASLELNLTTATINQIFTERFGKRAKKLNEEIKTYKEIINLNLKK